jgi:hypothetical protein
MMQTDTTTILRPSPDHRRSRPRPDAPGCRPGKAEARDTSAPRNARTIVCAC